MIGSNGARRLTAWISAVIVFTACGEFAHTNPLDPATTVSVTLAGPDSVFSLGDTVHFTFATNPDYAPEYVLWSVSGAPPYLGSIAPGVFVAGGAAARGVGPYTSTVTVDVDGRSATKPIVLLRRPAALVISNCSQPVDSILLTSLGSSQGLCTTLKDQRGYLISGGAPAAVIPRDPTMLAVGGGASTADFTLVALHNGTTYAVVSRSGITDSVRVVVRQVLAHYNVSPSACINTGVHVAPGDSIRISPTNVGFDTGWYPMDTAVVRAAVQGVRFQAADANTGFSVSADGWVRAPASGSAAVLVLGIGASPATASGGCWVFTP